MWDDFVRAMALVLVIEGMLPFLSPDGWRKTMQQAAQLPDSTLRKIGLASMIAGVVFLYLNH